MPPPHATNALEYAKEDCARARDLLPSLALWATIGFGLVTVCLVPLVGLHNDNPFYPLVGAAGVIAAVPLISTRALGRRRLLTGSGKLRAAAILWLVFAVLGGGGAYGRYFGEDPHVTARRINHCTFRIEMIGKCISLYRDAHHGRFPGSLAEIAQLYEGEVDPNAFICTALVPYGTPAPPMQKVIDDQRSGKNQSYVYLGKDLSADCRPKTIVAHDNPSNHAPYGGGMSVLYADRTARFVEKHEAKKILIELEAGHNPPQD